MSHYLQINGQRLIDSCMRGEHGALRRRMPPAATAEDKAGRDFVVARMKALGLSVSLMLSAMSPAFITARRRCRW